MDEENYLLKWNDFEKNLSDGLRSLKADNTFCDVTLACEDSQLEAHRVVLSVCSNFFKNILTKNSHTHPFLYMKGVRMADMESIVHFMYHGEANVALEDLESFLAAANELQIKGLTAPSVNQFKKSLKQEQPVVTPPPNKKVKKEKQPDQEAKVSNASRSVLKRRNTDNSIPEEPKAINHQNFNPQQQQDEYKVQEVDAELPEDTFENSDITGFDDTDYLNESESISNNYSMDDGTFSGNPGDDVASEVKRLTDQYLQKVDVDGGGVMWACTQCGKQGKMKHHVREHIESNHIDCLTFNCPFCNKEIKNRVALRSHISKNHREENLRSKGHIF